LITYWISADAKATLYASIVVLESLGHAIGDPLMAQIFASSMRLSPFWTAMPFFFAAVSHSESKIEQADSERPFILSQY